MATTTVSAVIPPLPSIVPLGLNTTFFNATFNASFGTSDSSLEFPLTCLELLERPYLKGNFSHFDACAIYPILTNPHPEKDVAERISDEYRNQISAEWHIKMLELEDFISVRDTITDGVFGILKDACDRIDCDKVEKTPESERLCTEKGIFEKNELDLDGVFNCKKRVCDDVIETMKEDPDVGGIGVFISYCLQNGLILLGAILSISASLYTWFVNSRRLKKNPNTEKLVKPFTHWKVWADIIDMFQRIQSWFIGSILVAAMIRQEISRSKNGTSTMDYLFIGSILYNGSILISFGNFALAILGRSQRYVYTLSTTVFLIIGGYTIYWNVRREDKVGKFRLALDLCEKDLELSGPYAKKIIPWIEFVQSRSIWEIYGVLIGCLGIEIILGYRLWKIHRRGEPETIWPWFTAKDSFRRRAMVFVVLGLYGYPIAMQSKMLYTFWGLVDHTGVRWSFGQIIAVMLWAPLLVDAIFMLASEGHKQDKKAKEEEKQRSSNEKPTDLESQKYTRLPQEVGQASAAPGPQFTPSNSTFGSPDSRPMSTFNDKTSGTKTPPGRHSRTFSSASFASSNQPLLGGAQTPGIGGGPLSPPIGSSIFTRGSSYGSPQGSPRLQPFASPPTVRGGLQTPPPLSQTDYFPQSVSRSSTFQMAAAQSLPNSRSVTPELGPTTRAMPSSESLNSLMLSSPRSVPAPLPPDVMPGPPIQTGQRYLPAVEEVNSPAIQATTVGLPSTESLDSPRMRPRTGEETRSMTPTRGLGILQPQEPPHPRPRSGLGEQSRSMTPTPGIRHSNTDPIPPHHFAAASTRGASTPPAQYPQTAPFGTPPIGTAGESGGLLPPLNFGSHADYFSPRPGSGIGGALAGIGGAMAGIGGAVTATPPVPQQVRQLSRRKAVGSRPSRPSSMTSLEQLGENSGSGFGSGSGQP